MWLGCKSYESSLGQRLQYLFVFVVRTDPEPEHFVARLEHTDSTIAAAYAWGDETVRALYAFEMKSRMPWIRLKLPKSGASLGPYLWW